MIAPSDAGSTDWGEWVALCEPPPSVVQLDLTELHSIDPLFLARLRAFIDWRCSVGDEIDLVKPREPSVCAYLERMHLASDLPPGCLCEWETSGRSERSDVLIPIRRLRSPADGDELEQELGGLYLAHFEGALSGLAEAFTRTIGEISDNATTHGCSSVGTSYVAAQRYEHDRCVLAVGDLGVGIPEHMRRTFPDLQDDGEAIREATKEGVSGTGDPLRGVGYQYVIDGLKETKVPRGELCVWSGKGRFGVETQNGIQERRRAWSVEEATAGTWVRLELEGRDQKYESSA
jgi:hypothetical protein